MRMIVSFHVASGGAIGALAGSRRRAVALGLLAHAVCDRIRHHDIPSHRYELRSGAAALLAIAVRRGPLDAATIGAVAGSIPDIEHVIRLPRPGGRKLFPSHRIRGFHRTGGISADTQLVLAGVLLGLLLAPRRP